MIGWKKGMLWRSESHFLLKVISLNKWRVIWWCLLLLYYTSMGLVPRHTCSLCILQYRTFVTIALECLEKKNQYIGPLHHPLPSLACRPLGLFWLQAVTPNYSTCISYNFFIFCPICLKFSHKFPHTYCFILRKYSKIR